jgi:hypothetical protein
MRAKMTGLAQSLQDIVGPTFGTRIPIRGLKLAQNLGQPCEFHAVVINRRPQNITKQPETTILSPPLAIHERD